MWSSLWRSTRSGIPVRGPQALGLMTLETPAGRRGAAPLLLRGAGSLPLRSGGSLQRKALTAGLANAPGPPAELWHSESPLPILVWAHRQAGWVQVYLVAIRTFLG
jgi:hypothetical protein